MKIEYTNIQVSWCAFLNGYGIENTGSVVSLSNELSFINSPQALVFDEVQLNEYYAYPTTVICCDTVDYLLYDKEASPETFEGRIAQLRNATVTTRGTATATSNVWTESQIINDRNIFIDYGTNLSETGIAASYERSKSLLFPVRTTAERTALTAIDGMVVYDSDLNAFYFYENGSWVTK